MEKYAALAMMTSDLAHSLIATAMAILVTIAAICSQTYLVSLLDALDAERSKARAEIGRSLQKFPLKLPFSNLPSFGLISAPTMAILLTTFLVLPSAFSVSKGVDVSLLKYGTQFMQSRSSTEPLVIGIDIGPNGSLIAYVNSKKTPWNKLGDSITSVLKSRPHELAYVGARGDATWADVVSAIGVLREHDAKVVLLTSPAAAPTTALSARSGK
jgi:biopolymer transport protein ExbD